MNRTELHEEADAILDGPGKEFRRQALRAFVANLENHIIGEAQPANRNSKFEVFYLTSYGIAFAKDGKVRKDGEQQWRWFRQLKDGSLKQLDYKNAKDRVDYVDNRDKRRAQQKVWREANPNYFKEHYKKVPPSDYEYIGNEEIELKKKSLQDTLKEKRDRLSAKGWKKPDNWTSKDRFLFFIKDHWALATNDKSVWTVYHFEDKKWRPKAAEPFKEALLGVIRKMVPDAHPDALKEIQTWPTECTNWINEQKERL